MTEHVLVWRPKVPGDTPPGGVVGGGGGDEPLRLIGMPTGLVRPARQTAYDEELSAAARAVLDQAIAELQRCIEQPGRPATRIGLQHLSDTEKATIADILGEGDVWAKVGLDDAYWRIVESVMAGIWRVESSTADGTQGEWIEIGAVPEAILRAASELPRATLDVPAQMPQGAMNAPALLHELRERSAAYRPGAENHVINFTLLPLTDVDADVLTAVLGQVPLVIRSGGYGSSRVFATGLRNVWAVQYVNGMGSVILDTLEIGGVPVAVLAAREDFQDSAERLAEVLQAFAR
jgi:hydrogenase-1 operon protein HyaF